MAQANIDKLKKENQQRIGGHIPEPDCHCRNRSPVSHHQLKKSNGNVINLWKSHLGLEKSNMKISLAGKIKWKVFICWKRQIKSCQKKSFHLLGKVKY